MFIEKIEQNLVKLNFYTNEEEIYLGDLVKVVATGKKGVLAQIIKIESPEGNQNYNTATCKILFTIEQSGKLTSWQGNSPGNDFVVSKLASQEVLSVTNTADAKKPAFSARLSASPETVLNIDISAFEKPSVLVADDEEKKNDFMGLLAENFAESGAKTVLVDFNGDFTDDEDIAVLRAGTDIKLPLNLKGLAALYDKTLSNVSVEVRAGIENIFSEIEDYLNSNNVGFIPFEVFLNAVKEECQANKTPELDLLSNSLIKLHKKGVFADEQEEITALFRLLKANNLVFLDLSNIDGEWKSFFVDAFVSLNIKKAKRNVFLLVDADNCDNENIIKKILSKGVKSGIKPIFSINHKTDYMKTILAKTANAFVLSPQDKSKLLFLKPYMPRIGAYDALVWGKMTNNVPLYIKSPVAEEVGQEIYISQDAEIAYIPEVETSIEDKPTVQEELPQEEPEMQEYQEYEDPAIEETSEPEYEQEEYSYEEERPDLRELGQPQAEEPVEASEHAEYEEEYDYSESDEESLDYAASEEETSEHFAEEEIQEEEAQEESQENLEEDFDYSQSEEFEDDSALDYVPAEDEEEFDYSQSEDFQDDSVLDYVEAGEEAETSHEAAGESEFTDEDLNQFMDYDDEEEESPQESSYEDSYEEQQESYSEYAEQEEGEEFSNEDLNQFMDYDDEPQEEEQAPQAREVSPMPAPTSSAPNLPVYDVPGEDNGTGIDLQEGDRVRHKKYGIGVINNVIGYSEKKLCSIQFEDVGRRLLDPKLAELEKLD